VVIEDSENKGSEKDTQKRKEKEGNLGIRTNSLDNEEEDDGNDDDDNNNSDSDFEQSELKANSQTRE